MARLICESCDHGYSPSLSHCPWCGCDAQMAHTTHDDATFDTEIYPDYFLAMFSTGEVFQLAPDCPLDIAGMRKALSKYRIITFNGNKFDVPIVGLALEGANNAMLKAACDAIIVGGQQPWEVYRGDLSWIDTVDLIEVAPGQASLKMYGAKMHSRKLQDLPIDPSSNITWYQRVMLREYCQNDLDTTSDLLRTFPAQLQLRDDMSAEYGVDLRSKSDAQIAEAVMKVLLPFKVERPDIPPGTQFYYQPPAWMHFQHLPLLELLARSPFTVTDSGSVAMTDELASTLIRIGSSAYKMGIGGLHSTESQAVHHADAEYSIRDSDVASYYPSLILTTGIYPPQIGETFNGIYTSWYNKRIAAKKEAGRLKAELKKLEKMLHSLP